MQYAGSLREFSKAEKQLLTGYILAYFWDVTRSFKIIEQTAAPNVTLHFALPVTDNPLVTDQLDSLGDYALALRDDFKKTLEGLRIPIKSAAIAVQSIGSTMHLGIVDLNKLPPSLQKMSGPDQEMKLEVYLPESETGPTTEEVGE